jgi:hypothetical protein
MSISDETLNKIKSDKIEQKPKWQFDFLNVSKWVAIVSTTILAALIFAVVLEYLSSLDLDLYSQSQSFIINYFVSNIPAILIILLIVLASLLYLEFKNTNKGYKYDRSLLIGGVFGLIFIVGIVFIGVGLSKSTQAIAPINLFHPNTDYYWQQPEFGLISGEIISLTYSRIDIRDYKGIIWHIYTSNPSINANYSKGEHIRAIGLKVKENDFLAKEIRKVSSSQYRVYIFR